MDRLDRVMFFPNGINYSHTKLVGTNGSTNSWNAGTVTLNTGAHQNSIAEVTGYLAVFLTHEPNVRVTLNMAFNEAVDGTRQLAGVGDYENGMFVGFDGLQLGVFVTRGGRRQYWTIHVTAPCTNMGLMAITLADTTFNVGVLPGMTVTQIVYAIYTNQSIANANIRGAFCFDKLVLYSDTTDDVSSSSVLAAFDGAATGVTATCVSTLSAIPATEEWIYDTAFNGNGYPNVIALSETDVNVFRLTFSRWSTGVVDFSIMDPRSNDFVVAHTWSPESGDLRTFNTSIPYTPTIRMETRDTTAVMTTSMSMASISSGTPATSVNYTPFTAVFSAQDVSVKNEAYRVIGVLQNPLIQNGNRNRAVVNVTSVEYAVTTPRPVRIFVMIGGLTDVVGTMTRHASWNAANVCTPSDATYVQGGIEYSNAFASSHTNTIKRSWDQLWLMPGVVMYICVKAAQDPVTCTVDATVSWEEH